MTPPPHEIGGNRVVSYAIFGPIVSPTGMTRHLVDGKFMSFVAGLAICRDEGETRYSLCYCNEDWKVLAASSHRSIEEARQEAEFESDGVVPNWQNPGRRPEASR
jgi:hypothetical protein